MSIINERVPRILPVECNFYWPPGPSYTFTIEGHTYPYNHQEDEVSRASDARYKLFDTAVNSPITFDAIDSESLGHPKTVAPPGVSIISYEWDFGDGVIGRGPVVNHTYKVAGSETAVVLIVTDSRGRRYSCRKPITLIFANEGNAAPSRLRSS